MYNTAAYIIYLVLTYLITVHVGMVFYRNGRNYILNLFYGDETITNSINKILLVGYYLLNLGYATTMISLLERVSNYTELLSSITRMTGTILITLGAIHFFNMFIILLISEKKSINHH